MAPLPPEKKDSTAKDQPRKEDVRPWPTAENELVKWGSEVKKEPVIRNGTEVGSVRSDSTGYGNPVIIELNQKNIPVTVSEKGTYVGLEGAIKPGTKPDGIFNINRASATQSVAIISKEGPVRIHFLPITDRKLRERFDDAYSRLLIFSGKEASVTDNRGLPAYYFAGKGQTLKLSMPFPEQLMPRERGRSRKPLPVKPEQLSLRGEYYPEQSSNIIGVRNQEKNIVRLPDGTAIMMQPGAKLELSYHTETGKEIPMLKYEAQGSRQFAQTEENKKILAAAPQKTQEAQATLKKKEEEFKNLDKEDRELKLIPFQVAVMEAKLAAREAEQSPHLPTGELAASFDRAEKLLRKLVTEREEAIINERKHAEATLQEVLQGKPDHATVVSAPVVALNSRGEAVTTKKEIGDLNMRAALLREAIWIPKTPDAPQGAEVKNNVLVIKNPGKETTLRIPGDGKEIKRHAPLYVVAQGPLHVDLAHNAPDKYSGQPLIIRAVGEKGKAPPPVRVETEKNIEFDFFRPGDALSPNNRYLRGMVADKEGKVTGFQVGENGPVIHLQPGQQLTLEVKSLSMKARPNIFANQDKLYMHPEREFTVTGGAKKDKAIEALQEQRKQQEKRKPTQERDIPPADANISMNTRFPLPLIPAPGHVPGGHDGRG